MTSDVKLVTGDASEAVSIRRTQFLSDGGPVSTFASDIERTCTYAT